MFRMWTIPNLISMLRILMTPFILVELSRGRFLIGGWLFGAAAFTDILDGAFARSAGVESKVGLYLDPIADKILLSTTYIGLAIGGAVPVWLVVLIFARDLWILLLSWDCTAIYEIPKFKPEYLGKGEYIYPGDYRGSRNRGTCLRGIFFLAGGPGADLGGGGARGSERRGLQHARDCVATPARASRQRNQIDYDRG